ncbi:hypothetical protein GLOTRDRAFT_109622 [Gloeophyllum trabeum ATCC 11539]|uniref:Uncharacterized protein n=1 Tax=Gloeophyllum trabeum (strain ATCC 11539 / FP-39264 / Madison 617) TaxID=670483 RepID=S7S0P7_GLOTA|nr:uncharacterized protein GLOTRDRAFT_109622 [Gloeophyllum trabeum ATCC 11539]EPQ59309.1 hypothetical protein GLOTRDRAFT_109622 [Gloeophyllum trabeum ATCC 11539]
MLERFQGYHIRDVPHTSPAHCPSSAPRPSSRDTFAIWDETPPLHGRRPTAETSYQSTKGTPEVQVSRAAWMIRTTAASIA